LLAHPVELFDAGESVHWCLMKLCCCSRSRIRCHRQTDRQTAC